MRPKRIFVFDPCLTEIIKRLVRYYLHHGSVNQIVKAWQEQGVIVHTNRIHTLLSARPTASINPKTYDLLKDAKEQDVSEARIQSRIRDMREQLTPEGSLLEMSQAVSIPAAVLQVVFADSFGSSTEAGDAKESKLLRVPGLLSPCLTLQKLIESLDRLSVQELTEHHRDLLVLLEQMDQRSQKIRKMLTALQA